METSLGVVFIWFWLYWIWAIVPVLILLILPLYAILSGFVSVFRRISL